MTSQQTITPERLHKLLRLAKFGWWKSDFHHKHYICSDYIVQLLGLSSEILPFEQFRLLIREDYRELISKEFASIYEVEIYEQTFPVITPYGEVWVHSKLGEKERDEQGHLIAWGFLQCITNPQERETEKVLKKFNFHLHQQNNISRSLFSFLKTEDTQEVIYKILKNLLEQYQGSRAYIFEYDWDNAKQNCSFEVNAQGVTPQKEKLTAFSVHDTPWWTKQITSHNPILLFNLNELPPEAAGEKELLAMQSIKSLMVIPMMAQDQVWGYMGIDVVDHHRFWNPEDYQWFATLGNIISICMELHRAKNKALKEQEYFKNLYRYMPVAYVRIKILYDKNGQPSDYQFTDLNPAFEKITGKNIHYFVGKTARETHLETNIENDLKVLMEVQNADNYVQMQYESQKSGQFFRAIAYSPEKDIVIALFSDITDIQKAHKAVETSEKELRNIYKNIPVGIEIYDKDGYLRDMNNKDMEIFGLKDKSQGIGVNLFDNPNIPEEIKQQIREQKNVDFKIKYDFKNIRNYYNSQRQGVKELIVKLSALYSADNQLEKYMLIIIDNTETSSAYSKIQEFNNFFSVIADFAKLGYFKWNPITREGFALSQWFKNWGEAEDTNLGDIVGKYPKLHPDDHEKIFGFYRDLQQGQVKNLKEEVRVQDGQGGWKWIRCTVIVKKYDPAHDNIELIGVNFDITELKEIEAKLIEAKNKAETLDKLKSAFLANMSHEIRTPLNAIVGFSNLLAETSDPAEQNQYISIIQENNDLLLQLISDILDLSKMEAGTFEIVNGDVDVNVLCHEIVRSLSLKAPQGVVLEFENFEPSCHLWSDRNRLMQVLTNFITNALKFTHSGSIRLGYHIRGEKIEFYVSDTGIGISPENLPTIFDRFVKLNSFIHGTGLGLSICKSIVEQLGGQIGVDSEVGKGSRFWFILPFQQSATVLPGSHLYSADHKNPKGEKTAKPLLLIAEDTESNFILVSTILKKEYTIFWARNGQEAVDAFRQHQPDLILMDIRMPGMDGLTATRIIRKENTSIPIIALTAFAFDSDKNKTLEAGCNAYLTKPVQAQLLKDTIRRLLQG